MNAENYEIGKPFTMKHFPGEAVDRHLKMYGHLPELGCCEHDQPPKPTAHAATQRNPE